MIARVNTFKTVGIEAEPVICETTINSGIGLHLTGIFDQSVRECLLRTVTALQSHGYRIPGKKIIINLAPNDLHKSGSGYDLAVALTIIAASGQKELPDLDKWMVIGELALDGTLRTIPGCLPGVLLAKTMNIKGCIIPAGNAEEISRFVTSSELKVYPVNSLNDAINVITGEANLPTVEEMTFPKKEESKALSHWEMLIGNEGAKRAIEIAAAGGHNVIIMGAPGSGKTSLAKALAELLPPMTPEEATETANIYSVAGHNYTDCKRPFRAPHYSCSMAALLGGGASDNILPGEVSLANNGILLLDSLAELPKAKAEALRGPMEDKKVIISRLRSRIEFPARFQLVGTTTPCPCGYFGEGDRCTCTPGQRMAYLSHLDYNLMQRMTIQVWTHPVRIGIGQTKTESIETVRQRVLAARQMQNKRYAGTTLLTNEDLTSHTAVDNYVKLTDEAKEIMERIFNQLSLSARSYGPILKIARTIADLAGSEMVLPTHVAEACSYRFLDRQNIIREITGEKEEKAAS